METQQALVIDRALKQLSDPALAKSKAGRRLEKMLVGARESGKLPADELGRASADLVREFDVPKIFAQADGSGDDASTNSGLAILFLLVLLTVLLALAERGSDAAALIQQLIDDLLALLKGN